MVNKDRLLSREEPSPTPRASNKYSKKMQEYRPSKVTTEHYGKQGPSSPTKSIKSPRSPESRDDSADDPYWAARQTRPQISPRRAFRTSPKVTEPYSHTMRSTTAVRSPRGMSPDRSAVVNPMMSKSPNSASPRSWKSQMSKKAPKKSMKSAKSENSPKSTKSQKIPPKSMKPAKSEKASNSKKPSKRTRSLLSTRKPKVEPLLSKDKPRVAAAPNSRKQKATYKPPVAATKDAKKQAGYPPNLASPLAVADAKKQARAGTRGRQVPLDLSHSMDSSTMHKDKYASGEGYSHKDRYVSENSTFQSGDQSLFNDNTQDFTSNDTYDDTIGDETFGDDTFSLECDTKRSPRSIMQFRFSNLSEGTSFGEGSVVIKQQVAWGCIGLSALQFAILTTQVLLCGVAALSINPTLGPYPDAFSEWGGKNTYLLVEGQQYFRFITPVFLHVGYLHFLVNAFFQLENCAYLEREWGFFQWISIYLISGFGSCFAASAIEPNVIGVCSSGALMGLFGARISQAILWTFFETKADYIGQGSIIFERLGSTVCSAAVVFCLTFLTYIDWAGHLGGLCTGFLVGFIVFSHAIREKETRTTMKLFGFFGLLLGGIILWVILFHYAYYDEELADACNYFRNLYTEGYSCECQAFS